jgi:hypothetical protein
VSDTTTAVKHGDDVTEITEADFSKVAGVTAPANRVPYVLLKSRGAKDDAPSEDEKSDAADKFKENEEAVAAGKEPTAKADGESHETDSESPEADTQEEEMTDSAAKAAHAESAFCGDEDCAKCVVKDGESYRLRTGVAPLTKAAKQSRAYWTAVIKKDMDPDVGGGVDRDAIPAEDFAGDNRSFPIVTPADVSDAALSIGRAGKKNVSGSKIKENIKAIAQRKGKKFVVELPKKWQAEAAKGQVQDALSGTKAPEAAGTIDGSQQSIQPATAGVKTNLGSVVPTDQSPSSVPGVVAQLRGGESAYNIPAESEAYTVANAGPSSPQIAMDASKAAVVSTLWSAMAQIEEQRQAQKAGQYLLVPGPADASAVPSSMPWENFDAATLDQVASVLAQCCNAVECIATREQIEALSGDGGDQADAWSLQDAASCLDQAMGIVARLAYSEGAEAVKSLEGDGGEVVKAYSRLRAGDEKALRSAHVALSNVLAEHERAKSAPVEAGSSEPSEGDKIQMELTKEELAAEIAASTQKAVADAHKAEAKKAAKAKKAEAKKAKQKVRKAAEREILAQFAQKNANNDGDITAQQEKDGVGGEHDASDIQSMGGKPDPKYMNKALKKALKRAAKKQALAQVKGQLEALSVETQTVGQLVKSFANRPRGGGPVLDGIPRGQFAANEQRVGEVTKGDDTEKLIKSLEERQEKSNDSLERQQIGFELTRMRLAKEAEQFGMG